MHQVAAPGPARGRWIWGLSGAATITAFMIPVLAGLVGGPAGAPPLSAQPSGGQHQPVLHAQPQRVSIRAITVPQPVTSLDVQSYGAPVIVAPSRVSAVQVIETIRYDGQDAAPPIPTESVSGGRLTLAAPVCASGDCAISFTVIVPAPGNVTVTADSAGGAVTLTGVAGATVNSGGGAVRAAGIHGPLTVSTDGGSAQLGFAAAPQAVTVSTRGGPVLIIVPGGPYAVTADSAGGPELIAIATDPAAPRTIAASSGGGPLQIEPAAG